MMNIKYYISVGTNENGTFYGVSEFVEDLLAETHGGKLNNKDNTYENISNQLLRHLEAHEHLNQHKMITFKFENIDIAREMGNIYDSNKFYLDYKKKRNCSILSSPAVFLSDVQRMEKAKTIMKSQMLLSGSILDKHHMEK